MVDGCFVVVPWVHQRERDTFLQAWGLDSVPDWLILQHDQHGEGCGVTKNTGIQNAIKLGAEMVVILDGDCFPSDEAGTLPELMGKHYAALQPQAVEMYAIVTDPPSRGTPYAECSAILPVAASMGFWLVVGDYCAVRQLAFDGKEMGFRRRCVYGKYFSLCGMNLAFRPNDWMPWCQFIDVPRFDDIWMGWLWQCEAYRRGYCFNLNGPVVRHSRQSNVWKNLADESVYLEKNETLWRQVAEHPSGDYESLRRLLPV